MKEDNDLNKAINDILSTYEETRPKDITQQEFFESHHDKLQASHPDAYKRFLEDAKNTTPIKIQKQIEDDKFTNALNALIEKNEPIQHSEKKAGSFEKYYAPIQIVKKGQQFFETAPIAFLA